MENVFIIGKPSCKMDKISTMLKDIGYEPFKQEYDANISLSKNIMCDIDTLSDCEIAVVIAADNGRIRQCDLYLVNLAEVWNKEIVIVGEKRNGDYR